MTVFQRQSPALWGCGSRAEPIAAILPSLQRFSGALVLALATGLAAMPALAQTAAATQEPSRSLTEWLTRMHEASRQRAYQGTLVVSAGANMSASKIWHVCDGVQQMEKVETLTGAPRTTIRHNNDVITFAPDSKTVWVEKRESLGLFPELLRAPSSAIPDHYEVRELGVERVAGHLADRVEVVPRDALRFGYQIWAEQKTGLVVKMQTLGVQESVLEQVAFSELQLNAPVLMDALKRQMGDTRGYEVHKPTMKKTTAAAEGWRLKEPIPGFTSMSCHTRGPAGGTEPASMQWVFSDGLASVSLFVEAFDPQRHGTEKSAIVGATHSLSQRLDGHWVTVLGEVPTATLRRFAQSLERTR
jgi:sigma-E factor negative regulatory protein RseB